MLAAREDGAGRQPVSKVISPRKKVNYDNYIVILSFLWRPELWKCISAGVQAEKSRNYPKMPPSRHESMEVTFSNSLKDNYVLMFENTPAYCSCRK